MSESKTDRASRFLMDDAAPVFSQCVYCENRSTVGHLQVCRAFPNNIPDGFLTNKEDHRKPFEGDQGIHFDARDDVPKDVLDRLYATLDELA